MIQIRQAVLLAFASVLLAIAPVAMSSVRGAAESHDSVVSAQPGAPFVPDELFGTSGNIRALIGMPSSREGDSQFKPLLASLPPDVPGVYRLAAAAPDGDSLVAVYLQPFGTTKAKPAAKAAASYRTGRWRTMGLAARNPVYAPPAGFISVTAENQLTSVSKRFQLRDFLTHDQQDVWPKVLVLRTTLLDKLELIGNEMVRQGMPGALHVMSGFRTPQYNAQGVGAKGGRARDSRHMYGDAADVIVDSNGDGRMDDLNGDGKVNIRDARVLFAVAERIEAAHPELVGGLSAYPANASHGPFVHVDTRGFRARW